MKFSIKQKKAIDKWGSFTSSSILLMAATLPTGQVLAETLQTEASSDSILEEVNSSNVLEEVPVQSEPPVVESENPPVISTPEESGSVESGNNSESQGEPIPEESTSFEGETSTSTPESISNSSQSTETTTNSSKSKDNVNKDEKMPKLQSVGEKHPIEEKYPVTENKAGNFVYQPVGTTSDFIKLIGEDARVTAQENDLYASVMIAQAILESGSGSSQLSQAPNYNLFGIKGSYQGKSASFNTAEDNGSGGMYNIVSSFRCYPSYKESMEDYVKLIKNNSLYQGVWKSRTNSYEDATSYLTGRYATDTSYNKKLNGLIATYNLTEYDKPKKEQEVKTDKTKPVKENKETPKVKKEEIKEAKKAEAPKKEEKEIIKIVDKTRQVVLGDTLWEIAQEYEVTIQELMEWNGLTDDLIYLNQELKVGEVETTVSEVETQEAVEEQVEEEKVHQVVQGDTLWDIAQMYQTTVVDLMELNHISNHLIYVDQELKVGKEISAKVVQRNDKVAIESKQENAPEITKEENKIVIGQENFQEWSSNTLYQLKAKQLQSKYYYEVKAQENIEDVSTKFGIPVKSLQKWNNLSGLVLTEGQLIRIVSPFETLDGNMEITNNQ